MPRGSKSVKTCNLDMAKKDGTVPHVSLFKLKHMRGWWPFTVNTDLEEIELAVSFVCNISQRNNNITCNYTMHTT